MEAKNGKLNPALPIFGAVGDKGGEAVTLYNIGIYNPLGEKHKAR